MSAKNLRIWEWNGVKDTKRPLTIYRKSHREIQKGKIYEQKQDRQMNVGSQKYKKQTRKQIEMKARRNRTYQLNPPRLRAMMIGWVAGGSISTKIQSDQRSNGAQQWKRPNKGETQTSKSLSFRWADRMCEHTSLKPQTHDSILVTLLCPY